MADMTDDRDLDIVTELRLLAEIADTSEVGLVMLSGRSFTDAADEIETLRDHVRDVPVPEYRNDRTDEASR